MTGCDRSAGSCCRSPWPCSASGSGWAGATARRSWYSSAEEPTTFVLARAITYATLFIAFALVWLPARVLAWASVTRPPALGAPQVAGLLAGGLGAVLALWCVLTFALVGRGTPAPFDPPRRLVQRGPYRWLRNPMYLGATLALAGAAAFFESVALLGFTLLFALAAHGFVVLYEEPALRRLFGAEYDAYCRRVHRWRPRP